MMLTKVASTGSYALPLAVGLSYLPPRAWSSASAVASLLGAGTLFVAAMVLDDVQGWRDGTDAANYQRPGYHRDLANKPLLSGLVTERQALGLGLGAWAASGLLWGAAVVLAPAPDSGAMALLVVLVLLVPQYSWGLRLSYRYGGEALLAYFGAVLAAAPPLLAGAQPTARLVGQAVLVGLWYVTLNSYCYTGDVEGDRMAGRATLAVRLGPDGNRGYLTVLAVGDLALSCALMAVTGECLWYAPVLAVGLVPRAVVAWRFRRTADARAAFARYWPLFHLGCGTLVLANVLCRFS